jgi:hypothetical protein
MNSRGAIGGFINNTVDEYVYPPMEGYIQKGTILDLV